MGAIVGAPRPNPDGPRRRFRRAFPDSRLAEAVAGEELEGAGAVRERFAPARPPAVLFLRGHLAKRAAVAIGQKDRVVAEAEISAGRPDQRPVDAADVSLCPAARQSVAQGR